MQEIKKKKHFQLLTLHFVERAQFKLTRINTLNF